METIEYFYLNLDTGFLVPNNETLSKEINGSQYSRKNTRAIPFIQDGVFKTLIVGGKDCSEEKAIEVFESITKIKITKVEPTTLEQSNEQ